MCSEGLHLLSQLDRTQEQIAKRLGVTQQAVSGWKTGRSAPSARVMAAIEDAFGIPMRSWLVPASPLPRTRARRSGGGQ